MYCASLGIFLHAAGHYSSLSLRTQGLFVAGYRRLGERPLTFESAVRFLLDELR
jgi:hypothetical protein